MVIVSQVARFNQEWNQDKASGQRLLNTAVRPIHAYTQDRIIREYLLFEQGQVVDPFALADSERPLAESLKDTVARVVPVRPPAPRSIRSTFVAAGSVKVTSKAPATPVAGASETVSPLIVLSCVWIAAAVAASSAPGVTSTGAATPNCSVMLPPVAPPRSIR